MPRNLPNPNHKKIKETLNRAKLKEERKKKDKKYDRNARRININR